MAVKPEHDAYGQELWNCHRGSTDWEIIERDDGLVACESARQYFHAYKDWPIHEREGLKRVRGRVLDIGAGAGRVALELQQRGMDVLAIDNSPLAIKTANVRCVKRARVLAIEEICALRGRFDTIVMYGNNFALFCGLRKARRLLREMLAITNPGARIIGSVVDPYQTKEPCHLAYHERNRRRGRMGGQLRLRVRHLAYIGEWFEYLFMSEEEVREIVTGTGWEVEEIIPAGRPRYAVVLEKSKADG